MFPIRGSGFMAQRQHFFKIIVMIVIVGDRHAGRWGHSGPEKHFFQCSVWTVCRENYCFESLFQQREDSREHLWLVTICTLEKTETYCVTRRFWLLPDCDIFITDTETVVRECKFKKIKRLEETEKNKREKILDNAKF